MPFIDLVVGLGDFWGIKIYFLLIKYYLKIRTIHVFINIDVLPGGQNNPWHIKFHNFRQDKSARRKQ